MSTITTTATTSPTGRAHIQLFAADERAEVRWRLLSGNNRELGRGAAGHPDAESCLLGIKAVLVMLDDLTAQVRRSDGHLWQWRLLDAEDPIVISGHAYDRQVRCQQAMAQFLLQVRTARPSDLVMLTGSRRWTHSSAGHSPMNVRPQAARTNLDLGADAW